MIPIHHLSKTVSSEILDINIGRPSQLPLHVSTMQGTFKNIYFIHSFERQRERERAGGVEGEREKNPK